MPPPVRVMLQRPVGCRIAGVDDRGGYRLGRSGAFYFAFLVPTSMIELAAGSACSMAFFTVPAQCPQVMLGMSNSYTCISFVDRRQR